MSARILVVIAWALCGCDPKTGADCGSSGDCAQDDAVRVCVHTGGGGGTVCVVRPDAWPKLACTETSQCEAAGWPAGSSCSDGACHCFDQTGLNCTSTPFDEETCACAQ